MKYIFIGFYFLGYGWNTDFKMFNSYEECSTYINEIGDRFKFDKENHQSIVLDWNMSCNPIIPEKKN